MAGKFQTSTKSSSSSLSLILTFDSLAAGLGNAVSDVAGIGLAHHIDYMCSKMISVPKLTPEQWNQPIVHWFAVIVSQLDQLDQVKVCHLNLFHMLYFQSKSLCIFLGCLIGMTPLLFIDHKEKEAKKAEEHKKE